MTNRSGIHFYSILTLISISLLIAPVLGLSGLYLHALLIAIIYAIIASNWDLSLGYGGLLNFAHTAFFALGVYAYAIAARTLDLNPWLALLLAGLAGVVAAFIIGIPVVRLRGIYVILVTFAFGQICLQIILSQSDITGGSQGMVFIPGLHLGSFSLGNNGGLGYYYLLICILVLSCAFLRLFVRSTLGLSVQALRDNEPYAVSRGVPVARQRLLAMIASAFFPALVGGVYAAYLGVASPEVFGFSILITVLSALLLGGVTSILGPIIAAIFLTLLSEWLAQYGAWRGIVIAVVIVSVLRFYPGGLWTMIKR